MHAPLEFQPGDEVVLTNGSTGVLYARVWKVRKGPPREESPTWFFLPDGAAAVGLVVMSQPGDIRESDIQARTGRRAGPWPSTNYRLGHPLRQAVYVAHMARRELPVPDASEV